MGAPAVMFAVPLGADASSGRSAGDRARNVGCVGESPAGSLFVRSEVFPQALPGMFLLLFSWLAVSPSLLLAPFAVAAHS